MQQIYIFGASMGGKHVFDTLCGIGIRAVGFLDNSSGKWGTFFEGLPVLNPNILENVDENVKVVIASTYHDEIYTQLLKMQFPENNIITKEKLLLEFFKIKPVENNLVVKNKILFDLSEGFILSGVVNWSLNLIEEFENQNIDYRILAMPIDEPNYDYQKIQDKIFWIDYNFSRYSDAVNETLAVIESYMPCKIIVNQITQVFWAACLAKMRNPEKIEIVTVIHSDFSRIYNQNVLLEKYFDKFICVSNEIRNKLIDKYKINPEKLFYRASAVKHDSCFIKEYNSSECFKIAYAARIEKAQKRADLLVPLIELLEQNNIKYKLNIAGDGTYLLKLKKFVEDNNLTEKVVFYGSLKYNEMEKFWKQNDIFINLSDIEGMPVSLLEAMSWGLAPVVTDTSGVRTLITHNENGYICECGDVEGIFNSLKSLLKNPSKIRQMGALNIKKIETNHSIYKYAIDLLYV